MSDHTSVIPPHVTPPDPLAARVLTLVFSLFLSVVLMFFIGFVSIEFMLDMLGQPLTFGTQSPSYDIDMFTERDSLNLLKSPFELITPKHHTKMQGPEVVVIYTERFPVDWSAIPQNLLIDGTPHPWEVQFGNNTWFARLQLQPGIHHVQVKEAEAEFIVSTADFPLSLPEDWAWNRPHSDTNQIDRCDTCHEVSVQQTDPLTRRRTFALGGWLGAETSCFVCHEREDHAFRHAALKSTTNQCFRCHSIH